MSTLEERSKRNSRRTKTKVIKKSVMMSPLLGKGHGHPVKRSEPQVCPDCKGMSPLLGKGHGHPVKRSEPQVCPDCKGRVYSGEYFCETCQGEGEI